MIADPMADLTGESVPGSANNDSMNSQKEVFNPMVLQVNLQRIDRIRSVMGIASGCAAGILGLTSFQGLACFIALHLFVLISIWVWKMNCRLSTYTKQSCFQYMTASVQATALSFTLFWTLFYGLVYLY
ncbi:hypothetical protein MPSEU_000472100 [Mayamaea pseudoterrestris]|nr:hypothetical protein MPSEU_000472100 [Mayamaea pseudoterrestris]